MIIDLPSTSISAISKSLVKLREEGGAVALGRVLTLVISTNSENLESVIAAANDASREHPMRVIVISRPENTQKDHHYLDAQIRLGGDAGASEVIILTPVGLDESDDSDLVMGLLLPDAPVVAWWSGKSPAVPSETLLGKLATRRITDALDKPDPEVAINELATSFRPGDTDFAWTRLTLWRTQLAAILDNPPYEPVLDVKITANKRTPSAILLAAWLKMQLNVAVELISVDGGINDGVHKVEYVRASGTTVLQRNAKGVADLIQPDQPNHSIWLPERTLRDSLAEELRTLEPDRMLEAVLKDGLSALKAQ